MSRFRCGSLGPLWNLSLPGGFIPARSASEGVARELAGRQAPTYWETSRLSASLLADPDPLARASGWYFRTDHGLVERQHQNAQARGSARAARRKTGADVLRDLQVVRVTPGRSGPPRLRFGLVFPKPPAGSSALHTSPKRKRGGPRERSQEDRRRRIERPPCCPRHSRPIRTPSLALRAGIPDPTTTGERNTKTRKRGGPRERSQEDRRRRIERPPGCPRHSRPIRTPSLALRAGIPDPTTTGERNTKSASEGVRARARRKTGADVLRDLQVVRVTPGRSGPPRSRFGLVFQTRPRLVSATPKRASEGVAQALAGRQAPTY